LLSPYGCVKNSAPKNNVKILIAEDDSQVSELLQRMVIRFGYQPEAVSDGIAAWTALQRRDGPQLAILDWLMPGLSGPEICRNVRKRSDAPYVYIILITGMNALDYLVEGMEAGADDYIAKPFHAEQLRVRLRAGQRIVELQQELLAVQKALEIRATHDDLTGLWNRAATLERLAEELARAERELTSMGVILFDIDHFKLVNDNYGHAVGDRVLRESARRLSLALRSYDIVGRYGGEEFLVIAPGCDVEAAVQLAERASLELAATPIITPQGNISITVSAGVTAVTAGRGIVSGLILEASDRALYHAKQTGRNRVKWLMPD
jgi:diguanylate cyclase (GGDEF)-like protein